MKPTTALILGGALALTCVVIGYKLAEAARPKPDPLHRYLLGQLFLGIGLGAGNNVTSA